MVGEFFENRETWREELADEDCRWETDSDALLESVANSSTVAMDLNKKFETLKDMNSDLRGRVSCLEQKVKDLLKS